MPVISAKIHNAALKFLGPSTTQETYATIVEEAIKLADAKYGAIFLQNKGKLENVYASHKLVSSQVTDCFEVAMRVFQTNKPKLHSKRLTNGTSKDQIPHCPNILFPLAYSNKCTGVLALWSKPTINFSKNELKLLQYYAPFATLAIQNSLLINKTKEALESRELFLSMAAHELKTPLTSIAIFTQLIQHRLEKREPVELDWINTVANETLRLSKLANELLQVNRISLGKLQYAWKYCALNDIIKRALATFLLNWPENTIAVHNQLPKDDAIWADYDKLVQVIVNLLINAAKFSPKGSPIGLLLEHKATFVTITISDKGNGIPKKDLPYIFEGFYRGSNSQHEGMGLGLYLTKQIIDAHKGTITIQSKINRGTDVIVSLPAKRNNL